MASDVRLAFAALAGAAATAAAFVTLGWSEHTSPPSEPATMPVALPPAAAATPAGEPAARAIAAIGDRVARVEASLHGIETKLEAALAARERTTASSGNVVVDAAMLQQAIEAAQRDGERAKFDAMKPRELVKAAEQLINTRSDLPKARAMLEALLQRNLTREERQQALLQLGIGLRSSADHAESSAALQQAIDLAGGLETADGAWAGFQMAWNHQFANDPATARKWFADVARSSGSVTALRIEAMWNAAKLGPAGDPATRAELEAVLRECGDDPAFRHIADDVRARLAR